MDTKKSDDYVHGVSLILAHEFVDLVHVDLRAGSSALPIDMVLTLTFLRSHPSLSSARLFTGALFDMTATISRFLLPCVMLVVEPQRPLVTDPTICIVPKQASDTVVLPFDDHVRETTLSQHV